MTNVRDQLSVETLLYSVESVESGDSGESEVQPRTNLRDIPYSISHDLGQIIDVVPGLINRIIATQDGTRYQLSDIQRHGCLKQHSSSPFINLLVAWGTTGMIAQELVILLDQLRLEKPLLLLMEPIPLELVEDITGQLTVEEGDTLCLRCRAIGFPYPKYYWFRGKDLVTHNTEGILEITDVGLNDTGRYVCRIHNSLKKRSEILWTTKCEVFIKENLCKPLPDIKHAEPADYPRTIHFKKQPRMDRRVIHGESCQLTVEAYGAPPFKYLWCKDGEVIPDTNSSMFKIASMRVDDVGVYRCTISNKDSEEKSEECHVDIFYPPPGNHNQDEPVIIEQPVGMTVSLEGVAVFRVQAQCLQRLRYQWFHDGQPLTQESLMYSGCTSDELRFLVKRRDQSGLYQCAISTNPNAAGKTNIRQSQLAELKINHNTRGSHFYATDKIAILLGQSNYRSNNKQLPAVKNDLYAAHDVFQDLGFKTISGLDYTLYEMNRLIDYVINMMKDPENNQLYVALYLVGHGFLHHGNTYLMPSSVQEGTQISKCLCMEEVERRITEELRPAMFLLIPDVCQQLIPHVLPGDIPPVLSGPPCKNKIVFGAATAGEESNEQKSVYLKERLLPGWKDISSLKPIRGIFSIVFFNVLRDSKNLKVQDIYKAFNDVFNRPDPTLPETKGKEQNPIFHINIEAERSLSDPVNPQGQENAHEKRKAKYDAFTILAPDRTVTLDIPNWSMKVKYKAKSSNVLELLVYEEDSRTAYDQQIEISYNILAKSVPSQLRPNEYYRYPDESQKGIKNKRGYIFYNLQHLQRPLQVELQIVMATCKQTIQYVVELEPGLPLLSNMWNQCGIPQLQFLESGMREACEHSESDDKHSSLESSI